jgi:hypothetical protein
MPNRDSYLRTRDRFDAYKAAYRALYLDPDERVRIW